MKYLKEILKDLQEGKISVNTAEDYILDVHHDKMEAFISEVIQVTRYNFMEAEKNLTPLIEKYKF